MSFLYVEIQVTSNNLEPERHVLSKDIWIPNTLKLEYFNNYILFYLETKQPEK